jgi:predicted  nucleic acid-binding Zn-ribbon protein
MSDGKAVYVCTNVKCGVSFSAAEDKHPPRCPDCGCATFMSVPAKRPVERLEGQKGLRGDGE